MSSVEHNASLAQSEAGIVSAIHALFERYGPAFVDLAVGQRSDVGALLEFYAAPLRFIGPTFHIVMKDNDAITGEDGMGGEIRKLREAHFAGSTLDKCDVNVLNARAALVDSVWLRRDTRGALMSRFAVLYLVALTAEGWRITSAVNTSS